MAFVSIPRDLTRVKSKLALNLTKRQLICFGSAVVVGIPAYIFTRGFLGNSISALLMIGLMLPFFFFAMYEKDGQPAEKILRNYIRTSVYWPGTRPYKTENFYKILEKEAKTLAIQTSSKNPAAKAAAKTPVGKRHLRQGAGQSKPR